MSSFSVEKKEAERKRERERERKKETTPILIEKENSAKH